MSEQVKTSPAFGNGLEQKCIAAAVSGYGYDLSSMTRTGWFGAWSNEYVRDEDPAQYIVASCPTDGQLDFHRITFDAQYVSDIEGPMLGAVQKGAKWIGTMHVVNEQVITSDRIIAFLLDELFPDHPGYFESLTSGSSFDWRRSVAKSLDSVYRREPVQ